MGPVQENETKQIENAPKKVPRSPSFIDALSALFAQEEGSLISKYPSSVHAIESHFLLVEGKFQIHDYEKCVGIVDAMITNYPESELTGFALLRLGKIYEFQDRFEDAVEVYKTVIKTYHDKDLLKQAKIFLKTVEI